MQSIQKLGVFDSGLGGLTVLNEICKYNPGIDILYFGDTARVPYGARGADTITRYALQDVRFLLSGGADAIVVACGTVSAVALNALRTAHPGLPIAGVIEEACAAAARETQSGHIAVLGTQATIGNGAYLRMLAAENPRLRVTGIACPLFVPIIESGISADDPIAHLAAERYLAPLRETDADAVILGCTHYPFLRETIAGVLPNAKLIDTGSALAQNLAARLGASPAAGADTRIEYCVSDDDTGFLPIANRFLDCIHAEKVRKVSIREV
ncbi:MAG: glutamate racemase [Clostridiales bacterium]|nr:glutamate racemase [Clostridiales bacterium]